MSNKQNRVVGGPWRVGLDGTTVRSRGQVVCLCKNKATAERIVAQMNGGK